MAALEHGVQLIVKASPSQFWRRSSAVLCTMAAVQRTRQDIATKYDIRYFFTISIPLRHPLGLLLDPLSKLPIDLPKDSLKCRVSTTEIKIEGDHNIP